MTLEGQSGIWETHFLPNNSDYAVQDISLENIPYHFQFFKNESLNPNGTLIFIKFHGILIALPWSIVFK